MDWRKYVFAFVRNIVLGCVLATVALGGLGMALAGVEGLINGAVWGFALGLVGGATSGLMWAGKSWSDYAGRASSTWLKNQTEGSAADEELRKSGRYQRW